MTASQKVLLVDDEPNLLRSFKRQLHKQFDLDLAEGGQQALDQLAASSNPYAVIVSDMRMPGMNGVELLARIGEISPDSVRMMITANVDQKTAVDAVNEGHIFRFLNKPCSPATLGKALQDGLRQYQLIKAEQELLTKTLSGSVSLMTEVLSMVNPKAFGRTSRVRTLARQLSQHLKVNNAWEIEIAAMLSQIGCITVPEAILEKFFEGRQLGAREREMLQGHPQVGRELVGRIPRLEGVAKIIGFQDHRFDGARIGGKGQPPEELSGQEIPLGGRILKVVLDYDTLSCRTTPADALTAIVHEREGWYDPTVTNALVDIIDASYLTKSVDVAQLAIGMVLDEHIETLCGNILVAKGQEVNESLLSRLRNFAKTEHGVREPIRVRVFIDQDNRISENESSMAQCS